MRSSCDPVRHFIPIQCVLSWLGGVPLENGQVLGAYICAFSWRLGSKIVTGENRLANFCSAVLTSHAWGCTRKHVCFVRSWPRGPRSASMFEKKPNGSNHEEASVSTPDVIR